MEKWSGGRGGWRKSDKTVQTLNPVEFQPTALCISLFKMSKSQVGSNCGRNTHMRAVYSSTTPYCIQQTSNGYILFFSDLPRQSKPSGPRAFFKPSMRNFQYRNHVIVYCFTISNIPYHSFRHSIVLSHQY